MKTSNNRLSLQNDVYQIVSYNFMDRKSNMCTLQGQALKTIPGSPLPRG